MNMLFPWLAHIAPAMRQQQLQHRLPHGLLLPIGASSGVQPLLDDILQHLLCTADTPTPCQQCKSCQLVAHDHPDIIKVDPDKNSIKVDQIREMVSQTLTRPQAAHRRIIVIQSAHQMNHAAANALLKTLEEPESPCYFILTTPHISHLPATIQSRCVQQSIQAPALEEIEKWLIEKGFSLPQAQIQWGIDMLQGPMELYSALKKDTFESLKQLRASWIQALKTCRVDPSLIKATQEQPEISLAILYQLLQKNCQHGKMILKSRSVWCNTYLKSPTSAMKFR